MGPSLKRAKLSLISNDQGLGDFEILMRNETILNENRPMTNIHRYTMIISEYQPYYIVWIFKSHVVLDIIIIEQPKSFHGKFQWWDQKFEIV